MKRFRVDIPANADVKILKHEFAGGEKRETHIFQWDANGKHHRYVVQDIADQIESETASPGNQEGTECQT